MVDLIQLKPNNLLTDPGKEGQLVQVRRVNIDNGNDGIVYEVNPNHVYAYIVDLRTLDPIPITPEWLEKCGFVFKIDEGDTPYESWIHSTCEAFILWNFNDEHWIFDPADQMGIDQSHFKYIHQLQNLYYALTGEELNVDN